MLQATKLVTKVEKKIAAAKAVLPSVPESQPDTPPVLSTYYAAYSDSTLPVDDKTSVFALARNLRYDPIDLWTADHAAQVHEAAKDVQTDHDGGHRGNYRAAASQLWREQSKTVQDEYRARALAQKNDAKKLPTPFE